MKTKELKNLILNCIISLLGLGVIIYLALGSAIVPTDISQLPKLKVNMGPLEHFPDGTYGRTTTLYLVLEKTERGNMDDKGRWHGKYSQMYRSYISQQTIEVGNMVHGLKHGTFTLYKGTESDPPTEVSYICYKMGKVIPCEKAGVINTTDESAFQILVNKYPWYLLDLNYYGFNNEYVEKYLDSLETVMNSYEFNEEEYGGYYGDAEWELEETPYDSIIQMNSDVATLHGMELTKNAEFRLAVIDRFWEGDPGTFYSVKNRYPGYLTQLNDYFEVTEQDFEQFCLEFDSLLASYGTLDLEDPLFIDSLDIRMARVAFYFLLEDSTKSAQISLDFASLYYKNKEIRNALNKISPSLKSLSLNASSRDIAMAGALLTLMHYSQGDILKRVANEAYMQKRGIINIPTMTTEYLGNASSTSVSIEGYIFEDGGSDINDRGIVWATFYNPTTNDRVKSSGTGLGQYSVVLSELTPGTTYYARAYASNSLYTNYGNCVKFTTGSTGLIEAEGFSTDYLVYPNPCNGKFKLRFNSKEAYDLTLILINTMGQVIEERNIKTNSINHTEQFDVSHLGKGIYHIIISSDSTTKTKKIIVL